MRKSNHTDYDNYDDHDLWWTWWPWQLTCEGREGRGLGQRWCKGKEERREAPSDAQAPFWTVFLAPLIFREFEWYQDSARVLSGVENLVAYGTYWNRQIKRASKGLAPLNSRGEYFSDNPIFLHGPQKWPCTGIQEPLSPGQQYFCTKPKKGDFSAHSSNISARTPKKTWFYAQLNK